MSFHFDPAEQPVNSSLIPGVSQVTPTMEVDDIGEGSNDVDFSEFLEDSVLEPSEIFQKTLPTQSAIPAAEATNNPSFIWNPWEMGLEYQQSSFPAENCSDEWKVSVPSEIYNQPAVVSGIARVGSHDTTTPSQSLCSNVSLISIEISTFYSQY
jgi:hypothetical protein